jgi:hypothetical protein
MPIGQMDEIFTTRSVDRESRDAKRLTAINRELAPSFGMVRGITHAKFLRSHADGGYYLLEIGACAGGAFFDQLVEASTGVNLWREWAKLEIGDLRQKSYMPPHIVEGYAGSVVCAAEGPWPDLDSITDASIVTRMRRDRYAGLIVRAASAEGVRSILDGYRAQFEGALLAPTHPDRRLRN